MRPDELSLLAAFDLLEMMFKSGVIAGRRPRDAHLRDRDAVCRLQDFLSQAKVTLAPTGSAEFREGERKWR